MSIGLQNGESGGPLLLVTEVANVRESAGREGAAFGDSVTLLTPKDGKDNCPVADCTR